ncbi:hypothetical protein HWV62_1274 [Athelia sp. TMB]|nr:hypothetical protein HWV62_1274 [Athelia sp. TMB]
MMQNKFVFAEDQLSRQLATLALVSRSFIRRSRHHQFKVLDLHDRKLEALATLIRSPLATFKPHVTKITLRKPPTVAESDLLALATALPNVQCISLRIYDDKLDVTAIFLKFIGQFESLKDLELSSFQISSFGDLAKIICASSKLETLKISTVLFAIEALPREDLLSAIEPPPVNLRTLDVTHHHPAYNNLFQWLNSGSTRRSVGPVDRYSSYPKLVAAPSRSLRSSLEHLAVDTPLHVSRGDPLCNLIHDSALKSFTCYFDVDQYAHGKAHITDISTMLGQISSMLEKFTICFGGWPFYESVHIDLKEVDELLQRSNFGCLQMVLLVADIHRLEKWAPKTLPRSFSRGVVRFQRLC